MIDWKHGKQIKVTKANEELLVFVYKRGDEDHPKIIHGYKVKCFTKTQKGSTT